jgi:hypothetical protein
LDREGLIGDAGDDLIVVMAWNEAENKKKLQNELDWDWIGRRWLRRANKHCGKEWMVLPRLTVVRVKPKYSQSRFTRKF